MKVLLLFLLSINCFSQGIETQVLPEEKYYYIGKDGIVTGWQGPWPVAQKGSIGAICEAIFEGNSGRPVKVKHLKLNNNGTLKCPAEKDLAKEVIADQEEADEQEVQDSLKAMNCGRRVKARKFVRGKGKGLSKGQKKNKGSAYKDIDAFLDEGDLEAAREEINSLTADGTLITTTDKLALIKELDKCK